MGLYVPIGKMDAGTSSQQIDRYQSPTGSLFIESVKEGFRLNPLPSSLRFANFHGKGTRPLPTINKRASILETPSAVPLSKEEWENDENLFRGDIEYFPSMTEGQAEILAKRSDLRKKQDFLFGRAKPGVGTLLTTLTGGIIGSVPDPTNFIPILNFAKATAVLRFGRVLGRAAVNSIEAGLVTAAIQPIVYAAEHLEQGDYDLRMAATNVSFAFGIGGGFGAISGRLSRVPLEERVPIVAKAMDDVSKGQSIDLRMFKAELTKENINSFIRSHVSGDDISGVKIAERGHPVFSDAVENLQQREPRDIIGKDLVAAIRNAPLGDEFQNLIVSKIDDVSHLRNVLSVFKKKSDGADLSVSEKSFLDSFVKGDKEFFEEIVSQSKNNEVKFKSIIKKTRSELKAIRELLDSQISKLENKFAKSDLKKTGKYGKFRSVIKSEVSRLEQKDLRGITSKSVVDDFKAKALRNELKQIIEKEVQYKKQLEQFYGIKDRSVFNNNRRIDAEHRLRQISGKQAPLRFDTAAGATEKLEPAVAKADPVLEAFDELSDEAMKGSQKAVDELIEATPAMEKLLQSELDALDTIVEREKKYASVGDVYKAVLDCLIKGE